LPGEGVLDQVVLETAAVVAKLTGVVLHLGGGGLSVRSYSNGHKLCYQIYETALSLARTRRSVPSKSRFSSDYLTVVN
jgi:hypothetical protein